jgi:hypothetical protein
MTLQLSVVSARLCAIELPCIYLRKLALCEIGSVPLVSESPCNATHFDPISLFAANVHLVLDFDFVQDIF